MIQSFGCFSDPLQGEFGSKERETRGLIHTVGHVAFEGMHFGGELSRPRGSYIIEGVVFSGS